MRAHDDHSIQLRQIELHQTRRHCIYIYVLLNWHNHHHVSAMYKPQRHTPSADWVLANNHYRPLVMVRWRKVTRKCSTQSFRVDTHFTIRGAFDKQSLLISVQLNRHRSSLLVESESKNYMEQLEIKVYADWKKEYII